MGNRGHFSFLFSIIFLLSTPNVSAITYYENTLFLNVYEVNFGYELPLEEAASGVSEYLLLFDNTGCLGDINLNSVEIKYRIWSIVDNETNAEWEYWEGKLTIQNASYSYFSFYYTHIFDKSMGSNGTVFFKINGTQFFSFAIRNDPIIDRESVIENEFKKCITSDDNSLVTSNLYFTMIVIFLLTYQRRKTTVVRDLCLPRQC